MPVPNSVIDAGSGTTGGGNSPSSPGVFGPPIGGLSCGPSPDGGPSSDGCVNPGMSTITNGGS